MNTRYAFFLAGAACWLATPSPAEGFGGRLFGRSNQTTTSSYYYYPVYSVVTPVYVPVVAPDPCLAPAAVPVPSSPQPYGGTAPGPYTPPPAGGYAAPSPAPPSGAPYPTTNPPPLAAPRPPPQVNESRYGGAVTSTSFKLMEQTPATQVSVAFWNLTPQPVVLRVAGNTYILERNKNVTLNLPYTFVWQIEGRDPQTERIPATEKTMDLVLRR